MKQAIITRFIPPTNIKGGRIKAHCNGDTTGITIPWDHELSEDQNHEKVARMLLRKLQWDERHDIVGGYGDIGQLRYGFWVLVDL